MSGIVFQKAFGFIEIASYQDDSGLMTGEIGNVAEFSLHKTHESEFAVMLTEDVMRQSKCKRRRREARGW